MPRLTPRQLEVIRACEDSEHGFVYGVDLDIDSRTLTSLFNRGVLLTDMLGGRQFYFVHTVKTMEHFGVYLDQLENGRRPNRNSPLEIDNATEGALTKWVLATDPKRLLPGEADFVLRVIQGLYSSWGHRPNWFNNASFRFVAKAAWIRDLASDLVRIKKEKEQA